jgi:hypothetical protein
VRFAGALANLGSETSPITVKRFQDINTQSNSVTAQVTDDGYTNCGTTYELTYADTLRST